MNNKGSTLILLIIVMTIIIALGASLLDSTMMQYNVKIFNSQAKQSFYMAETGLNRAFVDVYELIAQASDDAMEKANEYLLVNLNETEAENVFKQNYKLYITANLRNSVYKNANPLVEITSGSTILFVQDELTVNIKSRYNSTDVEKTAYVDITILIPNYYDIKNNTFHISDYLKFSNWS